MSEQKLICVYANMTTELNTYLAQGWKIINIVPFGQPVSLGGHGYVDHGEYGCYVVIEREC